ncbi:MAG TPA: YfhO family protein [Bacteroidia bacterium]|nr:YfhO family protein [Bacteroidia bacterium]
MKFDFKKVLPHLIAIGSFLAITLVYFSPLLSGKQVQQHDIMQWTGMSKEVSDFRAKYHTEPLWTGSMFSGMPAYQISVAYPANLIKYVNDILFLWLPAPACYIFLMLLGFYLLLVSLKIDYRLSIAGAIGFAFSSYHFVIIVAGHNSKAHAISLIPLVFAGILMVFRGRYLLGGVIATVALAMEIYANHLQITYYLFIAILVLIICELIKALTEKSFPNFIKSSVTLGVVALLAILPNITSLWATYEYGKYSTRSQSELTEKKISTGLDKDYALEYSYGISETFTLLIPRFKGGASGEELGTSSATYKALKNNNVPEQQARGFIANVPLYFGDMRSTAGPPYAGAIMFFLFVLGLFVVKGEIKWWLAGATILSVMLAWGQNFLFLTNIFFDHFPEYNKFRAVSMILTVAEFCIPLLGILAFKKMIDGSLKKDDAMKYLKWTFCIVGGFCLVFVLLPGMFSDFIAKADESLKDYSWLLIAIRDDRANAVRMDALRSLFFVFAAAVLIWASLNNKIKQLSNVYFILAMLALIDQWPIAKRYLNDNTFVKKSKAEQPFQPTQADLQIQQDPDPDYRVMNTTVSTFNDASTSYFHKSIGGYHGAKLKRYQELVENQISKNNQSVMNMLNTKYFIFEPKQGEAPVAQLNPGACGSVWFVKEFKMVANADSEINALSKFDPKQTVFIDERFKDYMNGFNANYDSTSTIRLVSYLPNDLIYESKSSTEQFAVYSEIYYDKGWNAYVDGKRTPHIRVNYVLRGMRVPAGNHKIEFKFEPTVYATGEKISLASSALLILIFAGVVFLEIKKSTG